MENEIENELDKVKLKYSDADVEQILKETLSNGTYDWMIDVLISAFNNYHITKLESECNEKI
jgi:hypothetical protein